MIFISWSQIRFLYLTSKLCQRSSWFLMDGRGLGVGDEAYRIRNWYLLQEKYCRGQKLKTQKKKQGKENEGGRRTRGRYSSLNSSSHAHQVLYNTIWYRINTCLLIKGCVLFLDFYESIPSLWGQWEIHYWYEFLVCIIILHSLYALLCFHRTIGRI